MSPRAFAGFLDETLDSSHKLDLEGVMAKQRQSVYQPGRRSQSWLRLKHASTRDALIVGCRTGTGERSNTFGSLLLAAHDDDDLIYLGRVGTGFNQHQLQSLRGKLDRLSRKTPPVEVPSQDRKDAHWVTPSLVGEVTFSGITEVGRIRLPVWRGLRDDIAPDDVSA